MGSVLLVLHQGRPEATRLAADIVEWAAAGGHELRLPRLDADLIDRADLAVDDPGGVGWDLALSLGGDGTMLRTVDLVSAKDVPVLGVNVGQLGYLVEIEPPDMRWALDAFFAGEHHLEERMRLEVVIDGGPRRLAALNEAVLEKTPSGHTVRLGVSVDGTWFTSYTADGLIVATPTGSTAYALSARAPIVAPGHRALVLTPVAPHMLFDRSLVLEPSSEIAIEVNSWRPAELFLDGRSEGVLTEGQTIRCTASPHPAKLVTFRPRKFLGILKSKFGLNDR
jgi:NAD+ kinase